MRIVSLLPSATEIVCALGLADDLVGVSHACDYPAEVVRTKAVVTSTVIPKVHPPQDGEEEGEPLTAGEIDEKVRESLASGESLYRIDIELLRSLAPDIILTQGLCDICAVNQAAAAEAVSALGGNITVLDLAATTLEDVLLTFRHVGEATGKTAEAEALISDVQARWDAVRARTEGISEKPRVLLLEWPEPPFTAGHWNPELIALGGGLRAPWDSIGVPSRTLEWDEVVAWQPEVIVVLACGFDAYETLDQCWGLTELPGWYDLPAVRDGECYAADGNAYFNRPGPRLVESAEILATILHPEVFSEMLPPYSVQRFDNDMLIEPDEDETQDDSPALAAAAA